MIRFYTFVEGGCVITLFGVWDRMIKRLISILPWHPIFVRTFGNLSHCPACGQPSSQIRRTRQTMRVTTPLDPRFFRPLQKSSSGAVKP